MAVWCGDVTVKTGIQLWRPLHNPVSQESHLYSVCNSCKYNVTITVKVKLAFRHDATGNCCGDTPPIGNDGFHRGA